MKHTVKKCNYSA